MADTIDPNDPFENGLWNSDAEPINAPPEEIYYTQPGHMTPEPPEPKRKRRRWPWVLLGVIIVILIAAGVYAYTMMGSVKTVKAKAQSAMGNVTTYVNAAKKGDSATMQQAAATVSKTAHEMQTELNSPAWSLTAMMPVVGSDVESVRTVVSVMTNMTDDALVPLSENAGSLKLSNLFVNDKINIEAVQTLATAFTQVSPAIHEGAVRITALPKANLPQVAEVLEPLKEKVGTADAMLSHFGPLIPHLPTLLGAGGVERHYLVLAQNNAEVHATGGFVGAIGTINVKDGDISMGEFDGVWNVLNEWRVGVNELNTLPAGATDEEIALFTNQVNTHHGDHNMTPDFSRVGELYFNINKTIEDVEVDGVVGIDPVFLQYMLRIVGGVDTSFDITVDGTNAAPLMENQTLFWMEPAECDKFYNEVAAKAFKKILADLGKADTSDFFSMLLKAADEGRFLTWIRDATVEQAIKDAGFGWELKHDPKAPMTGIYFNDQSGCKGSYYLSANPEVGTPKTNGDGSKTYPMTVTIRHNMDRGLMESGLPEYIKVATESSPNRSEVDLYESTTLIAPQGGKIQNITFERLNSSAPADPEMAWAERSYQGLDTWQSMIRIDAGETVVLHYEVVTSPEATEPLAVRKTPVIPPEVGGWPA